MVKRMLVTIAQLAALILALAIIGELFCRLAMPLDRKRDRYMATRNIFQLDERNVVFDEDLGYTLRPRLDTRFDNEEFRTSVSTNSMGFRDDEGSLDGPSILLLGDSFGFGWGVDAPSGCEAFLERITGKRVLNMGVSGYGTLQEFLALKAYAGAHDIRGRTAVFLLYPNDVADTAGFGSGSVKADGGTLRYSKFDRAAFEDLMKMYRTKAYRGISQKSYVLYLLKSASKELKKKLRPGKDKAPEASEGNPDRCYDIFALAVNRIGGFCARNDLRVIFVWIPSVRSFEDGKAKFGSDSEEEVFGRVKGILDKAGLPLIDAGSILEGKDYYRLDGHLNPSGHRKLAEVIVKQGRL